MDALSVNHLDFAARLQRIGANAAQAQQLLFVGVDEVYSVPRASRVARLSRSGRLARALLGPACMVLSLALGIGGYCLTEIASFHLQETHLAQGPALRIGLGLILATALGWLFLGARRSLLALQATGVVIGFLALQDIVRLAPAEFAQLTSETWVSQVLAAPGR